MANERLVLCGPARLTAANRAWRAAPVLSLRLGERRADVRLRLSHLTRKLCASLPPVATDLLELAALVYAADQAVPRGGTKSFEYGLRWRRHFRFEVPVREPGRWQRAEIQDALSSVLGFLTDDHYEFGFTRERHPRPLEGYLFGPGREEAGADYHEVLLFSGGLDSLGGAVRAIFRDRHQVALVSHRPVNKVYRRQCDLVAALEERLPDPRRRPLHIAVEVNKAKPLGRDFNQRSRSFLFAAVAAVVARTFGLPHFRFYENGVTSFNLPISPQVLGGRASRTTHPQALTGFGRLFSLLFDRPFEVHNPFLWDTKTDVLAEIKAAQQADLCAWTGSCTHTWQASAAHPHCGRCSQCVDRYVAALAAGLDEQEDPPGRYHSPVLTGPREGAELTLIERYVGVARRLERTTDPLAFARAYGEVARALRHVGLPAAVAAERTCALYRKHGQQVLQGLERGLASKVGDLLRRRCPPNCLARIAFGGLAPGPPAAARPGDGRPTGDFSSTSPAGGATAVLTFDDELFEARIGGKPCPLGNTKEYSLLKRLARRAGAYVSLSALRADVWHNEETEKNAIQRTVSNLRRKLRDAGLPGVVIDGQQAGHYRLLVPS